MAESSYILELLKWIFGYLGIPSSILLAIIENKFHIINRLQKRIAIFKNSETTGRISLEYKTESNFEKIKEEIKKSFRKEDNFRVVNESKIRIDFIYDIFSIKLILNQNNNIVIEIEKFGCGIRDLKNKINKILGKLTELPKNLLTDFIDCDLVFSLPYKWDDMNIMKPKGFTIKKYNIGFSDDNYKSSTVEVSFDKITIKSDAKEAILHLVDKFI